MTSIDLTKINPGFMQGRLCPLVAGKIQAFPIADWETEFPIAANLDFDRMEWTLDHEGLADNPLMTADGQKRIAELCQRHKINITSATLDCVMQAPFYKVVGQQREKLFEELSAVVNAAIAVGIKILVVPLVDNGALDTAEAEGALRQGLQTLEPVMARNGIRIAFECDFDPDQLAVFISTWSPDIYGITYDIGNSAALGFDPTAEFAAYGDRVIHVHIKDRISGGTTVPLGSGAAQFEKVFQALAAHDYRGVYILQTARAEDEDHGGVLKHYRDQATSWIAQAKAMAA